jgi:hypothetical protein
MNNFLITTFFLSSFASQSVLASCLFESQQDVTVDRVVDFSIDSLSSITAQDIVNMNQHFVKDGFSEAPFTIEELRLMDDVLRPALEYMTSKKTNMKYVFAYSFPGENMFGTYYELATMKPVAYFVDTSIESCDVQE